jgi:predicted enzyme related to lactoylglutathione lyase
MIQLGSVPAVVVFSDDPSKLAAWYRGIFALEVLVEQEGFIGMRGAGVTLFVQQTSEGHRPGIGGIRPHFLVEDCQAAHQALCKAGAREILPVVDTGGELVAAVQDPEGNPIGLLQPLA